MSHYTKVQTAFRAEHIECLADALATVSGVDRQRIRTGEHVVTGYGNTRETVHLSIPRDVMSPRMHYQDLAYRNDGQGGLERLFDPVNARDYSDQWFARVAQQYARNVAIKTAPIGYRLSEKVDANGTIQLQFVKA